MKTILAPVDFSAITGRVCQAAATLAKAVNGRVRFLHSVPPPVMVNADAAMLMDYGALTEAGAKYAKKELARLNRKLKARGLKSSSAEFIGPPVPEILAEAKRCRATYIVMGSHGHGALYDLLVGSTAHGVMSRATCPVILVPPAQKQKAKARK